MGIVRELDQECLPKLRDILESQMPNSLTVHGFVSSLIQYDLQELRTQVFVAMETSFRTFLVLTPTSSWERMQSITVYYEEEHQPDEDSLADEELAKLMESVPGLDWAKPVYLYGCNRYVLTRIRRLMNSGRLMADPRYHSVSQVHAYVLSREDSDEASQIRLVEGYTLGRLTPAHAEWVHDHWTYKNTETKYFFWDIISKFPSVAVFEANPAENDMTLAKDGVLRSLPVAWILKYPDGSIGSTFTLPEHRRKGLARLVSLSLSRKVGELCSPVFVYVDDTNAASIEFHQKMGFRRACPFAWEVYAPSDALDELASGEGREM